MLEPELYERAEKLFRVLLRYVTDFLVWEENFELSAELQPRYSQCDHTHIEIHMQSAQLNFNSVFLHPCRTKDNAYYCVLYNDEHHSYDHVIYTLQRSVNCDQAEAQTHTTLIDKEVFFGFIWLSFSLNIKKNEVLLDCIILLIISIADNHVL